ncbi:MAG: hypothetical protein Q9226_008197 [Calogaya cf. arnoldii]
MHALLSSTLSFGITILQETAVVAVLGLAGCCLWTSMKRKPTLVVSKPVKAAAAAPLPRKWVPMPSFDVCEDKPKMQRMKKNVQFDLAKNTLHRYKVSEHVEAAAAAPLPRKRVPRPSFEVREDRPKRQRKKKSVHFDLAKNSLHRYTPVKAKFVAFAWRHEKVKYLHEYDPAGYDTLHCVKTKYIRDVPDLNLVDDDGDIGMDAS